MEQENKEEKILNWFKDELLPKLIKDKRFSPENKNHNWILDKLECETTKRGTDHFTSIPYFIKVVLKSPDDKSKTSEHFVVVKFASQHAEFRAAMRTDAQFKNEAAVYNLVLPTFQDFLNRYNEQYKGLVRDVCPICYYADFKDEKPEKAITILEDLRKSGFKVADSKVELDLHHCTVALRQLAKFHAISLAMKIKEPEKFDELKNLPIEVRYLDEESSIEFSEYFLKKCNQRGIDYLLSVENSEVPQEYLLKFRELVSNDVNDLMRYLIKAKEPLALICHGDFCRNNMLFRYENNRPVDAKLFDFQTFRYGSTSHDLAFFFYMNTTLELREKHFQELFSFYHSTLIKTAAGILEMPEKEISDKHPLSKVEEEFAQHAVYGYVIASFFLPMMMAPPENNDNFEQDFITSDVKEMADFTYIQGGEATSQRISEIIIDFYRRGFYN